MARRTKIIATIGPACDDDETMVSLIREGMDVARINTSHGTLEQHLDTYQRLRAISNDLDRKIGILIDLPGPKVRCATFIGDGVELKEGDMVTLSAGDSGSTADLIQVQYEPLTSDVRPGDRLAFGDGTVVAIVEGKNTTELKARVVFGGVLRGRPGLHIPSDRLRITAPTSQDLKLLDCFVDVGADMVALSFVRSAHDIRRLGVEPAPRGPLVVAKIETRAAVDNLDGIIRASGAVMVARGDLGNECPIEELPHLQKQIIKACVAHGRPAITATQMLESMISSPIPTRAEASDVANAVFDGSSAVMLSGETAVGRDPVNTVRTMARICERADQEFNYESWAHHIAAVRTRSSDEETDGDRITDALTMAAWRVASQLDAKAILCLSRTGFTVRSIARFRPTSPILGFTPESATVDQLALSWGTLPIKTADRATPAEMITDALQLAREHGGLRTGDLTVVVSGQSTMTRATDSLRVVRIP